MIHSCRGRRLKSYLHVTYKQQQQQQQKKLTNAIILFKLESGDGYISTTNHPPAMYELHKACFCYTEHVID